MRMRNSKKRVFIMLLTVIVSILCLYACSGGSSKKETENINNDKSSMDFLYQAIICSSELPDSDIDITIGGTWKVPDGDENKEFWEEVKSYMGTDKIEFKSKNYSKKDSISVKVSKEGIVEIKSLVEGDEFSLSNKLGE